MASNYGFVYVLRNECMPGIYKIGMTDRAPSCRCEELSRATAVPLPFEIVCFVEVDGALDAERELHARFGDLRINPDREFFALSAVQLVNVMDFMIENWGPFARGELSFLGEKWRRKILADAYAGRVLPDDFFSSGQCPGRFRTPATAYSPLFGA